MEKDPIGKTRQPQDGFEQLIQSYIASNVGLTEHFLTQALATQLKSNLLHLHANHLLIAAGTGNQQEIIHDTKVRGDAIYWLDRKNENVHENTFFQLIDDFILYLNESCYTGITGYEFHYTLYERGSFYKRHVDQFKNNSSRQFSMICYLNEGWVIEDGGQLLIKQEEELHYISPTQGKTVFFKSDELEHEVLVTHQNRMSITGWLKRE